MTEQEQLNQRVERDVRTLVGDLHMQILILRAMLDEANQKLQAQQATNGLDRMATGVTPSQPRTV